MHAEITLEGLGQMLKASSQKFIPSIKIENQTKDDQLTQIFKTITFL